MRNPFTEPMAWRTITIGGVAIPARVRVADMPDTWRGMGRTVGAYRASFRFEMSNDDARDFWAAIMSLHRRRMIRRHLRACAVARSRVLF